MMVTIDPGWNTGVCIWRKGVLVEIKYFRLTAIQLKELELVEKLNDLTRSLNIFLSNIKDIFDYYEDPIDHVIIEGVSLWGNDVKSQASALRGDAFNLAYLVGMYVSEFLKLTDNIQIIDVRSWKGQLPTPVLRQRVFNYLEGNEFQNKIKNEHLACAVGIGMNELGAL